MPSTHEAIGFALERLDIALRSANFSSEGTNRKSVTPRRGRWRDEALPDGGRSAVGGTVAAT
ncbi:MAG: hypothetical protein NZ732_01970, partial [Candidatus Poseidoniales archaeon]|nr:hypothetical protein [Candidatus Poseidoniales archaeon]